MVRALRSIRPEGEVFVNYDNFFFTRPESRKKRKSVDELRRQARLARFSKLPEKKPPRSHISFFFPTTSSKTPPPMSDTQEQKVGMGWGVGLLLLLCVLGSLLSDEAADDGGATAVKPFNSRWWRHTLRYICLVAIIVIRREVRLHRIFYFFFHFYAFISLYISLLNKTTKGWRGTLHQCHVGFTTQC